MAERLALAKTSEPLGLSVRSCEPPEAFGDLGAERFEFSSRGDRVPGRLLRPARRGEALPLVLLQHGAGGSKDAAYLDAVGGPWVERGVAVASIDYPLHGERADAKLRTLLEAELAGSSSATLLVEFARQALVDQQRALDALAELPDIDGRRVVYVGFSLGALVGAAFCGLDRRPRAAVLALGGAGGPPSVDPAHYVSSISPRPILFVQAERDERISRAAADALFAAAKQPKERLWFDVRHADLPGDALKKIWQFVSIQLALPTSASG